MAGERGTAIDIDRVTKIFETNGERPVSALEELSVHIAAGEFLSVVGPSGCGKSTLMLMTAGLLQPSSGEIRVAGNRLISPLTDVGIVFQDDLLLEFRSALDNVLLQGRVRKLDMRQVRQRADELLEQLGVAHARSRYPRQLSGGMRQRVSLARALVHSPSVLLMDEPFGSLDALTRLQVRFDLEQLWRVERRIVREIVIDLPRPRPLALGEAPELSALADRIYELFEKMGVLHDKGVTPRSEREKP